MRPLIKEPLVAAAGVLAVGLLIGVTLCAYVFYQIRTATDILTVTGSARETVKSDHVRWTVNVSAHTGLYDQQAGYDVLARGAKAVEAYLKNKGFIEIEKGTPNVFEQYGEVSKVTGYQMSQDIVVSSDDVGKVHDLSQDVSALQGAGYLTRSSGVEYTYSKLDDLRVTLLSNAIKDAKARAEAIAKESERQVGALKSASSGVVQVLAKGGVDISDYGSYDTQSVDKDVMVTVRGVFGLR